jgi:hypothetical protein
LEFLKHLVNKQYKLVVKSPEYNNELALGLFGNDEFNEVVYNLFGPEFLGVCKNEFSTDT